jgi:PTS system cellobiose-specific IIA component
MDQKNLEAIMSLIVFGGNAKSDAMEAIQAAKSSQFELANQKLRDADSSLIEAHHSQTNMLTQEASGEHVDLTLLMVHGQDHLMTSITFVDLAKEFVALYKKIG